MRTLVSLTLLFAGTPALVHCRTDLVPEKLCLHTFSLRAITAVESFSQNRRGGERHRCDCQCVTEVHENRRVAPINAKYVFSLLSGSFRRIPQLRGLYCKWIDTLCSAEYSPADENGEGIR
jgi:hypothetical protein